MGLPNTPNDPGPLAGAGGLVWFAHSDVCSCRWSHRAMQITLGDIYIQIMQDYAYYRARSSVTAWKNSIRHNLTMHKSFIKVCLYRVRDVCQTSPSPALREGVPASSAECARKCAPQYSLSMAKACCVQHATFHSQKITFLVAGIELFGRTVSVLISTPDSFPPGGA
jgi:hypothetical protein